MRRLTLLVAKMNPIYEWLGNCPICHRNTTFRAQDKWFRDYLICTTCADGSYPRERALFLTIEDECPNWRDLRIHESSPLMRGASPVLAHECRDYVATYFFPGVPPGDLHRGFRCEDLECQTFADESFDIVISQDVMEHVLNPERAYQEVWRTLRPGGVYIHTTPIYKDLVASQRRADRRADGSIHHLFEPEYHGNPIDDAGALVTFHFGYDLADLIAEWADFDVEIRRFNDRTHGIVAEFSDVIICRKRGALESDWDARFRQLAEAQASLAATTKELQAANEKLAAKTEELQAANEKLERVFASTSWRLTAPVRAVRRLLG